MVDVNEGRRLLAEATDGPWKHLQASPVYSQIETSIVDDKVALVGKAYADGDLIVWLRNNAEALLDAVEKVEALKAMHSADSPGCRTCEVLGVVPGNRGPFA